MSNTVKIVIGIIVVAVIAVGAYLFFGRPHGALPRFMDDERSMPAGQQLDDSTALPSGSSTSDQSLDQDMNAINAQMDAASSDAAGASASVDAAASGNVPQ